MSECGHLETGALVLTPILLCMAVGILVVLAFTKRRKKCCQECCDGRPGLIIPVNLLHTGRYHIVYAVIFGAMSNVFLTLALDMSDFGLGSGTDIGEALYEAVISPVIIVVFICLLYAPVFACVDSPLPIVGHTLGLLYTTGLVILTSVTYGEIYKGCYGVVDSAGLIAANVLSDAPIYTFFVIILIWYFYQIVKDIATAMGKPSFLQTRIRSCLSYYWPYNKILGAAMSIITDFRFPLRFLAPLMVMLTILFKFSFITFIWYAEFTADFVTFWKNNGRVWAEKLSLNGTSFYDIVLGSLTGFGTVGVVASFLTFLLCLILLVHMAAVVPKHLKLAVQGKFDVYSGKPPSHAWILASSLKYSGYQIGYFVWAWFIYYFGLLIVGGTAVFIILGIKYFSDFIVPKIIPLIVSPIVFVMVAFAETLICKYMFLEGSGGKFLMITNKNAFSWVSYFLFLYNAIVGFFGAILRVFLALLFGTLLLFRLDTNIMMRGFQFADLGNKTYQGFLYVEHSYNNCVVNAFVALMCKGQQRRSAFGNCINSELGESAQPYGTMSKGVPSKRQIRNRWLVAYTLVHNPSLCQLRASRLRELELQNRKEKGDWVGDETNTLLRFK